MERNGGQDSEEGRPAGLVVRLNSPGDSVVAAADLRVVHEVRLSGDQRQFGDAHRLASITWRPNNDGRHRHPPKAGP